MMGSNLDHGWTDTRVARVKELWTKGKSAAWIAAELGGVTRNAVLGKVHRMGWANLSPKKKPQPRPTPPRPKIADRNKVREAQKIRQIEKEPKPEPFVARTADVAPLNLDILQLRDTTCRFPYGDEPPFTFCGHPVKPDRPYCEAHCRIVYQPRGARNLTVEEAERRSHSAKRMWVDRRKRAA